MISENAVYWIMLTQAIGYSNPKPKMLTEKYPDIAAFFSMGKNEWRLSGLFTAAEIDRLSKVGIADAQRVIKRCGELRYSVLTIDDDTYPECLYHIYAPPAVLYISGQLPDMNNRLTIGIVGTRRASRYGVENSYKIAYALSKYNAVIVSGGALGVDCASHRGALAANGTTVCVRGCGINSRYLRENEGMRHAITVKGAVISEYPPDVEPRGYFFPARNRIIAALSDGVLVIEAGKKSGSLITADFALDMGKDLFALLSNNSPNNEGSNRRIKEGTAIPVTDFMDILAAYEKNGHPSGDVNIGGISMADINTVPVKGGKPPFYTGSSERVPANANPSAETREARSAPKTRKPQEEKSAEPADSEMKTQTVRKRPVTVKTPPAAPKPVHQDVKLTGDAERIYRHLTDVPVHIDKIADELGLPVSRVLSTLTLLELQGLVRALKGRNFVLK